MIKFFRGLCVLCIWTLVSCAPAPTAAPFASGFRLVTVDPNSTSTATPFQPALPTDTPIPAATVVPTDTSLPTDTATFTPVPPTDTPISIASGTTSTSTSTRTQYTFYVNLKYSAHSLAVDETIRYINTTGQNLFNVVLAVETNLWNNCFYINSLSQDGRAVTDYSINGQRLTINLSQPLAPGSVTNFALSFNLFLPSKSFEKTFGYLGYQLNLTDWYPFIVPYSAGWVLHDPWAFGEHLIYDSADYDVNIKVDDPNVVLAASAPADSNGAWTHYHLDGARTFVLSASDHFKMDKSAVGAVQIRSYYFAGDEDASSAVVWMATQSLGLYEAKFGPYPYQSLSVVETDVADGQEFDGLVFLATNFYSQYNGTAKSDLITIGTHEIAHQWWFGSVGDDQALEPWLDEAMAVYSEKLFYEYNYPHYGDWWWNFRVNYFGPAGYVDGSIYDFPTFRSYVNAVYLNGANFLDDLRTRIGDQAFFAFLKDYAARYAGQRVSADNFFATVRLHTDTDYSDIIQKYFQKPH
jgi:hypothetical protein